VSALGSKDTQLAQLIDASNAVFQTFAAQNQNLQSTLHLLPGALSKTRAGLGKLSRAAQLVGPTLRRLEPFAKALAPAEEASRPFFAKTAPIFKNEIRPFARQVQPTIRQLGPSLGQLDEALPGLASSFSVFNEFFNELAYNPGPSQGGFLFFLDWATHNFNSALSSADAHGPLGRTLAYLNCEVLPILGGVAQVNSTVKLLIALLNPPSAEECVRLGLKQATAKAAAATAKASTAGMNGRAG
jgi:phospholipid/cholesterol/gamma-HCH transport system substrate-binding protein